MLDDCYKILGITKDADTSEIKKAYRELALKYHPDKNTDDGAEAKFKEVSKAYKALMDQKLGDTPHETQYEFVFDQDIKALLIAAGITLAAGSALFFANKFLHRNDDKIQDKKDTKK